MYQDSFIVARHMGSCVRTRTERDATILKFPSKEIIIKMPLKEVIIMMPNKEIEV